LCEKKVKSGIFVDQNPFRKSGSHVPGSSGVNRPSPTGDNFRSMPNDNEEGAFKAPSFDSPADDEKKGIANRFNQAEQAAKEIGGAVSGKRVAPRPSKEDDPLTSSQREKVDTAKLAAQGARALAGDERALAEMAEHPIETAKQAKSVGKLALKVVIGVLLLVAISTFLIFSFISNFSQKHVGQVVKDVAFAPLEISGARRAAQIFSSTLFGGDDKVFFDAVKVLKNLGEDGKVSFSKGGKEMTVEEFSSSSQGGSGSTLHIGTYNLTVPANIASGTDPQTIQFVKDLELAMKGTNLLANEGRPFRSPAAKKLYKQNGINLFRWEKEAKDVKSYSDNMKSLYDQVKDTKQSALKLEDVDESGKKLDPVTTELLGKELSRSQKSIAIKTADIAWEQQTGHESLNVFAEQARPAQFVIASYCTAKSYLDNYETIAEQKLINAQRSAMKQLSGDDQEMVGKVNPKAVSSESQQLEFFEDARPYLQAVNIDVTNRRPVLNEGQLAYQNPEIIKKVMEGIVAIFEDPFGDDNFVDQILDVINPINNSVVDTVSDWFTDAAELVSPNAIIEFIADRFYPLLCKNMDVFDNQVADFVFGYLGQKLILEKVKAVLEDAKAYELLNQLGLDKELALLAQPTENFMKFMYRTQKTIDYAGLDDGAELVSKQFEGITAFGNEMSRKMGGRPMTMPEQIAFRKTKADRDYAIRKEQPLTQRLFSLENQYSPVSLLAARSPKSLGGTTRRVQTQLASVFSPASAYGGSLNTTIAAAIGNKGVAYARATNDKYDKTVMFGYSDEEMKKMNEDISFWPKQNRDIVEADLSSYEDEFGKCYSESMSKLVSDDELNMFKPEGKCTAEKLAGNDANNWRPLRYRLLLADNFQEESLKDAEIVTQNTQSSPTPGPTGQLPTGEASNLAQQILDSGRVTGDARYMSQIQGIADGTGTCPVNPTILSLILELSKTFTLNISSLNRRCTGVKTKSGESSYHYREGGGHAVDFNYVNGVHSTGATSEDIKLLNSAVGLIPSGSGIGQSNCRSTPLQLPAGVREFSDSCDHIHIQVPVQ